MKVAVEVVDARDLQSKDGHGTASSYVEVELDGQRRRTLTKRHDLNPRWNETLFFDVFDPLELPSRTIHVSVLHHRDSPTRPSFLGRVFLSGSSISPSRADAPIHRCHLDRRPGRPFSGVRGDIALGLYAAPNDHRHPPPPPSSLPRCRLLRCLRRVRSVHGSASLSRHRLLHRLHVRSVDGSNRERGEGREEEDEEEKEHR